MHANPRQWLVTNLAGRAAQMQAADRIMLFNLHAHMEKTPSLHQGPKLSSFIVQLTSVSEGVGGDGQLVMRSAEKCCQCED